MKLAYFFPRQQNTCLIVRHNARLTILMINRLATNENKTFLSIFSLILLMIFFQILLIYIYFINIYSTLTYVFMSRSHTWVTYQNVRQACFILCRGSRFYSTYIICQATKSAWAWAVQKRAKARAQRTRRQSTHPQSHSVCSSSNSPGSS